MRRLLLVGGAAALIALPSAALAGTAEQVPENDPTAEEGSSATTTTTKALHAEGRGVFRFEGSGGLVIDGAGVVRVRDESDDDDLARTPTGFGATRTSRDGEWTRYAGDGVIVLDGSDYTVTVSGRFTADADPTAANPAAGVARVTGKGQTILKGGVPVPFWASQRILLTAGPMSVDLSGRGGRHWTSRPRHLGPKGDRGAKRVTVRRVVTTRRVESGRTVSRTRTVTVRRWWSWDRRAPGATWRLNGPAAGSVELTTITGRVRVWDRSAAKDLAVVVPAGTTTTTLADGSVVYSGLKGAKVSLTGTGFRMKVRAWDVEGTFTPAPGSLARSFVHGKGSFDAGANADVRPGRAGGVRVLLQPVGSPA